MPDSYLTHATPPEIDDSADLDWTLALAGGSGDRLGDYVQQRFGQRIPKQYCRMLGSRSMIQHTLGRLNEVAPASRTLTVIGTDHAAHALPQLAGLSDHVFRQPASRDSGLALYVALAMIKRWNPNALVTITPTDHYVAPAGKYVEQVKIAQGIARKLRDRIVILGVRPTEAATEFGYLALGDKLTEVPQVAKLAGFVEKPNAQVAAQMIADGALWNTMVTCGTVDALWELGRAAEPQLLDILDSLVPLIGTPDEDDAIDYIYRAYLPVNFARDILERAPERLAAIALDGVEWSDWARPERIEAVLAVRRSHTLLPVARLS